MPVILPSTLRRAELRSFWLSTSVIALITLSSLTGASWGFIYGAAPIVCFSIVGLVCPRLIRIPYRVWNKCAKLYARFAGIYIMAVSFHLIVRVVGLTASSGQFSAASPSSSFWVTRRPMAGPTYDSQYEASDNLSILAPWPAGFLSWAWRSGNIWAACLLPVLIMVSAFELGEEPRQVSDTYTLF